MNAEQIARHIDDHAQRKPADWRCRCPAHNGEDFNLSVRDGDKCVLLTCNSHNCTFEAIVEASGLKMENYFYDQPDIQPARRPPQGPKPTAKQLKSLNLGDVVAEYVYNTIDGDPLYRQVRYEPKGFRIHRWDGSRWVSGMGTTERTLYHADEVWRCNGEPVFFVEGEKDVDNLRKGGLVATTLAGGSSGPWSENMTRILINKNVFIIPDNDKPGRELAERVRTHVPHAKVLTLDVPEKGDVTDWLDNGGSIDGLLEMTESIPVWEAKANTDDNALVSGDVDFTDIASLDLSQARTKFTYTDKEMPKSLSWYTSTVEWMKAVSAQSGHRYHEAMALWAMSAVANGRVHIEGFRQKPLDTMLYMLLVGPSSLHSKTSAVNNVRNILAEVDKDWSEATVLPDNSTSQRMIQTMSGKMTDPDWEILPQGEKDKITDRLRWSPTRTKFFAEAAGMLKDMSRSNGNSQYHTAMLQLYDNNGSFGQSTIAREDEKVEGAYLAACFDLTLNHLHKYAAHGDDKWQDGFWARFLFAGAPNKASVFIDNVDIPIPDQVIDPLRTWHKKLGTPYADIEPIKSTKDGKVIRYVTDIIPAKGHTVTVHEDTESRALLREYHAENHKIGNYMEYITGDNDLMPNYTRFATTAYKIAGMFASIDGSNTIELSHAKVGIRITEQFRMYLHEVYSDIAHAVKERPSVDDEKQEAIVKHLNKHNASRTVRQIVNGERIFKNIGKGATQKVRKICEAMVQDRTLIRTGKNEYSLSPDYHELNGN